MGETFTLPAPISTNALQRTGKGRDGKIKRHDSPSYKVWKKEAAQMLQAQLARPIQSPYAVTILLPRGCRLDVDNASKAPLDALEKAGVLDNDRNVNILSVQRTFSDKPDGGQLRVIVETVAA